MSLSEDSYFGGNSTRAQQEVILIWADGNLNKRDKQLWEGTEVQSHQSDFPEAVNSSWPRNTATNTGQCDSH